jgi:cell fate (sporulation/competence/biofilm development) regulator YlbF (YheA/YmcA/DUF963 family)
MLINVPGSTLKHDAIVEKTRELCGTIVSHPTFVRIQERMQAFFQDEKAVQKFREVNDRGEYLHHKQAQGESLGAEEVEEFEKLRQELLKNPLATGFLEAQEEMQKIQRSILDHVSQTFELGRVPKPEEISGGSCGSGCGCQH